ncbi:50S ribosomal protein L6 [Deferribacter desulfuricans SSM1]|uniref:Large ribosomal subunit protein uL6 n=1 Tax=Deferribacter desulfuricans (strain DSM 14783 / JCM 11476 / NBRC 101012 / SSM1) TaxID=639282 RepID=D3P922_DEFDS|nr:50S ribosomal protein L6 [Deferribacter desulfuricans]BAI81212.1 50S ribosomal protein L6 [Deferribacter desulfuricans SSM1]
MSRIGKKPINIPNGVKVTLENNKIIVEGPKGKLERELHPNISVEVTDNEILVKRHDDSKTSRSFHGLYRSLINNMVEGVSKGFEKRLEIVGVGYRAALKGKSLDLSLGFSHPVVIDPPEGIEFVVENPQKIVVKGIDKQLVGQVAANIRKIRKPEPYKGKGIRYEGEYILRKAGKSAK